MEDWLRKAIEDGLAADARERAEEVARYEDWKKTSLIDRALQRLQNFSMNTCRHQYLWPECVQDDRLPTPDAYWRRKARKLIILAGRLQRHPAHAEAMAGLQATGNADRAAVINLLWLAATCDVDATESAMRKLLTRPDGTWLADKGKIRSGLIHSLPVEVMRAATEASAVAGREDPVRPSPPTFLDLKVDPENREVRRKGRKYAHTVVTLSEFAWPLFKTLFEAEDEGVEMSALQNAYKGDGPNACFTMLSKLRNGFLIPLDLSITKGTDSGPLRLIHKSQA